MRNSNPDIPPTLTRVAAGSYVSPDVDTTIACGAVLGSCLQPGDVVVLTGDLGAGKTQLTKGIASALGIADDITSPTFTIGMSYANAELTLHHFDLYRLDSADQLEDTGILDVAGDDGICVVEWGEAYANELGDDRLEVSITRVDGGNSDGVGACDIATTAPPSSTASVAPNTNEPPRCIKLVGTGPRSASVVSSLDAMLASTTQRPQDG